MAMHPTTDQLDALLGDERFLPFLPMIYVAWSDGELTEQELTQIRQQMASAGGLDEGQRAMLDAWLDAQRRPTATQLRKVHGRIREAARTLGPPDRASLAELGERLAGGEPNEETGRALRALEDALGVIPVEAARSVLRSEEGRPSHEDLPAVSEPPPAFDVVAMCKRLDGDGGEIKRQILEMLAADELFRYPIGELHKEDYRELVMRWLQRLAQGGVGQKAYPGVTSDAPSMADFISVFEALSCFDLSLVIKFGVQFGLFGGSIYFLGTEKHREKYLPKVASCELPGCFAMSELGHGSNVRSLCTTATYDPAAEEFVIHTPSNMARKDWIGNAARHGKMATVFAQLHTGGDEYGVHAFLVPLRDDEGQVLPGIKIADCGFKVGLNGVDNGRIWFDRVRIPRENLLDRYGRVLADGTYESEIESGGRRFFTMIGTLVAGRVSIAAASCSAAKSGLAIAVRYATMRRQFGPSGKPEIPIMDYRTHQRRLMPLLAKTYAVNFAIEHLIERYTSRDEEDSREVEALAAGLKSYASWHATETLQTCRECCGAQGYMRINRIGQIQDDVDIFTTFEGDNTVLMQLVTKGVLSEYRQQFSDMKFFNMLRFLADQASAQITARNPARAWRTNSAHLRDAALMLEKLLAREQDLTSSLARRLRARISGGQDSFEAFLECQDHVLALAHAHVERVVLEKFAEAVDATEDEALREQLAALCHLHGMCVVEEDMGWFLEHDMMADGQARALRSEINDLCHEVRQQALHLVNAFGIPDEVLAAPIAFDPAGEIDEEPETSPL